MLADKLRTTTSGDPPNAPIEFVGSYIVNESSGTSWTFSFDGNLTGGTSSSVQSGDMVFVHVAAVSISTEGGPEGGTFSYDGALNPWNTEASNNQEYPTNTWFSKALFSATGRGSMPVAASATLTPTFQAYVFRNNTSSNDNLGPAVSAFKVFTADPLIPADTTPVDEGSAVVVFAGFAPFSGSLGTVTNSGLSNLSTGGTANVKLAAGVAQYDWVSGTVSPSAFDLVTNNGFASSRTIYIPPL